MTSGRRMVVHSVRIIFHLIPYSSHLIDLLSRTISNIKWPLNDRMESELPIRSFLIRCLSENRCSKTMRFSTHLDTITKRFSFYLFS